MRRTPLLVASRRAGAAISADTSVPALLMKIGSYPIHHGSVGAVRSLGRLGIPVYAVTEGQFTPAARSRYVRETIVWHTSGNEDAQELVAGLRRIGGQIGARAVLVATDDEAALLVAEHAAELEDCFFLPHVDPDLPRRLASKGGLATLCRDFDVPSPGFAAPQTREELFEQATAIGYPVILKNDEAFLRLMNPAVPSSTLVRDRGALERLVATWPSMPSVFVQEYLPPEQAQDWIVHTYMGRDPETVVGFTGIKLRSWPPRAGVTALAYSTPNPELLELAVGFQRAIGFRGIADLDWRLDLRDGRYKLLDFNPRVGAQFRMFETSAGVDVVRALHLDLTGRPLPAGAQVDGRRYIVGHLAGPSALASRHDTRADAHAWARPGAGVERAWMALDDPLPAAVAAVRVGLQAPRTLTTMLHQRRTARDDATRSP
jgi:predicted ATP-grasp superfamily ATP-dependent carboligase